MLIEIDGSYGEGGGQILRTAIALSAVTGKPVKVYNIRAKRPKPGLQAQHLTGVKAVAMITKADVKGLQIGSMEVVFHPKVIQPGKYTFDVGTAGSISLVLQSLLPALAFAPAPVELEITGGTDVSWSPPIDYMRNVFIPMVGKMGYRIDMKTLRRGHYPKGGGKVVVRAEPVERLKPVELIEQGSVIKISGISHCVRLPKHVASRQAMAAKQVLQAKGFKDVELLEEYYPPEKDPHLGPGSGIVLWAHTSANTIIGADALGSPGKPAEKVGEEAATKLIEEISSGAAVDSHMGDMLIPYIALASGFSKIKVSKLTLHAQTAIAVVEKFLDVSFKVDGELEKTSTISVCGVGFTKRE